MHAFFVAPGIMRNRITYILAVIVTLMAMTVNAQDFFMEGLIYRGYDILFVENTGVKNFIDDRSYDKPELLSNYSFSIVKQYSKGVPSKPEGILLRWNSSTQVDDISQVVVTLVESDLEIDMSILDRNLTRETAKFYYPDVNRREYLLCNMCPQKYCYYKVEEVLKSGAKHVVKSGKFYSDGQVRMLRVDGMANVRDFGGWHTSFGRPVLYGRLFRGNRPEGITATGKNDFVKNEHITADLDLRGKNLSKSPLGSDLEYYCTNNQRYKLGLTSGTSALAKDLNIIADVLRRGGNLFLHCNHGMNRAGTLSFLIGGILGFNEADLNRDYELSSFAYGNARSQTFGDMLPYIRSFGNGNDDLTQCFYNYALSIGVSQETLDTIRCIMLDLSPNDPAILNAHRR